MRPQDLLTELSRKGINVRADGENLRILAPKGALTPEMKEALAGQKQAILAHLLSQAAIPVLAPVPRTGALAASSSQRSLWLIDRLEGASASYILPVSLRLQGRLRVEVLERSLEEIVRRHESLRTCLPEESGAPTLRILPASPVKLPLIDLRGRSEQERAAEADRLSREVARTPFTLGQGPLVRFSLLRLEDEVHLLLVAMHHIISDAWSMGVLLRELMALYEAFLAGKPSPLPELPVQYADFAEWQRRYLEAGTREAQLGYWRKQLAGSPPRLEMPTDRPRPRVQTARGATLRFGLDAELARALKRVGQEAGATLYMTLLAAFQVLLSRYSGQQDVCVGSPMANRKQREAEALIGFFINTLVLRTRLEGEPSFLDLLQRVRQDVLDAFAHQDVPFDQVVEALQPTRNLSHTPLFQAMFVMHNAPSGPLRMGDLTATPTELDTGTAKFDLTLTMEERDQGLKCSLEYNTDLFDAETAEGLAEALETLLRGIAKDPRVSVWRLPLLSAARRHQVLEKWNDTRMPYDSSRCVHHLFEEQADRTPDAIAVIFGQEQVTYRQLDERANRLAWHLRELGVGPEVLVGFCIERSVEQLVGLLALLKAGAAYLALDPLSPRERNAFMMEDAQAAVLLTQRPMLELLPAGKSRVLCVDEEAEAIARRPATRPAVPVGPETLSYVLYTSGSTGRPKGIAMENRPLTNLIAWQVRYCTVPPGHRTLQFAPWNFDICVQETFSTWATGGAMVVVTDDVRRDPVALLDLLRAQRIQRLHVPFVVFQQLAEACQSLGRVPEDLREVYTAGEQLQITPVVEAFFARLPQCVLHNNYGPSEAHVITSHMLKGPATSWPRLPPVGRPLPNTRIYLLDKYQQPVPPGVPGELYVGGDCLARGYLHRPDITRERFVPDPFSTEPGARVYRTGDLTRYLRDGSIEFLGRVDFQVKIRGFRVELGEVEAVLCQHPEVREAVTVVREDKPGDRRLVSYVVPKPGGQPAPAALRVFVKERLPDYMVPSIVMVLESLPQSNAGKVERQRLPVPSGDADASYVAPRTPTESTLAEIWAQVLAVAKVGVHDNFFDRGGHSLLATRTIFRVAEAFGVELPLRGFFEEPTVEGLARRIDALRWAAQGQAPAADASERDQGEL